MRALILIAGALVLAACSKNGQTDNTQNVDENLTAENIVSNDVTAIDAVTGDAANMAADVDMNFGNLNEISDNTPATQPQRPSRPAPRISTPAVTNTAANTVATATTNAQ